MIPKIIHYCWFGNGPIPEKDKKCINSWKKYCSDYKIIQWNEKNYDITKNKYMNQAYQEKKWGFVPDYARLDIIYTYGGIYLDTDVEIIKSFDSLLSNRGFAGFERPDYVNLGLGFGAEAENIIIKKMLEKYKELDFLNADGSLNLIPSPQYSTEVLIDEGYKMNNVYQKTDAFTLYPKEYFCPRDYYSGQVTKTENTYSIHWFNASWQTPHQRRMLQVRRLIGSKNYNKLIKLKNKFFRKED